jgi:hypothetical protein
MDRVADVAQSLFVIGVDPSRRERRPSISSSVAPALNDRPFLSRQATLGRNSQFYNLTSEDREALGGIEYRSLKLLLKIVAGMPFEEFSIVRYHVVLLKCCVAFGSCLWLLLCFLTTGCCRILFWRSLVWSHLPSAVDSECPGQV